MLQNDMELQGTQERLAFFSRLVAKEEKGLNLYS